MEATPPLGRIQLHHGDVSGPSSIFFPAQELVERVCHIATTELLASPASDIFVMISACLSIEKGFWAASAARCVRTALTQIQVPDEKCALACVE